MPIGYRLSNQIEKELALGSMTLEHIRWNGAKELHLISFDETVPKDTGFKPTSFGATCDCYSRVRCFSKSQANQYHNGWSYWFDNLFTNFRIRFSQRFGNSSFKSRLKRSFGSK